ncbi:MAG: leucine-rich repeat domain-containing protein, partial [Bacteroidales bacterium]|nr:leucine-rich repeat domain-containing protein [Bacteroidales bacterium]
YIPAFICYGLTGLTSVTIGESVTSIGNSAFYECTGLTSVTIPESVTIIGGYTFGSCSGLTSVVFNADSCTAPTSYSDRPFYGCDNISSFTFGNSVRYIPAFICYNMTGLTSVTIGSSVTGIGESAFYGCSGLTSVTIGESVTSIGNYAFYNCSGLTTVTIPNSVTSMGREAFRNCSGLIEVTIPAQVTSIEQGAFANCTALTTVNYHPSDCEYLYDGEMELDKALFAGDTNITTLNIGSNVRRIPALSFTTIGIDTLVLHDSVLYIGQHAFSFCRNLHSVTIGRYTDTIMQAFAWDTALQTINFNADSCRYMGYMHDNFVTSSFGAVDSSVMTINFGSHVKSIPNYAFQSMPKLVNVNLPASLRHIGDFAFARTGILGHLVIPDSVRYIGWYAFYECDSITALTIGRQVDTIDRTSFLGCRNLQTVYFNADSCHYMGDVTGTNSWYAPFGNDTSLTNLYIGANVKYIPDYSFACYTAYVEYGLRHIYWGDSIQYIGKRAFYNTLLADTIYLPERVEQIGDYAFYNCDSMTAIVIGENVTSIGQQAFGYCDNLRSITLHADTPAQLGSNAFSNTPSNKVFYIPCGTTADYNSSWGYFNYEEPEVDFGVMLNVNDWSMGSVMAVSSRINCVDSSFIIRATPNYHYHFVGWSNGNTANPDTLYLNRDTLVTAFFAPDRYQINVVSNDSVRGTVSGGGEYDYLDTITLSATAVDHYHFVRWSNSWQSYYDNPQQYVVTGNASFTAYFSIDQHQVSVSSNDDMKGVVNGGGTFDYGSPCTLTAIAYTGYQFAGWSNGQTANPYAFPVTGDVELVAMFVEAGAETATVTALSADPTMGTATVNGGSTATVMAGDSVTLVATSNDGFRFVRWNDNSPDSIRTVVVTSDIVYIAYFQSTAVQTYTVTATSSDPTMGVATVNGGSTATVTEGEMVTLVATANDGYRFVRWSDDSTDSTRTVVVTGDMVYIAYFESVSSGMYTVTVSCNDPSMGQAWVNDDSIAVVEPGETVILTAIPGEGYRFVRWNDNNTDNIRAVVVIGDMNFVAYFEVKQNPNAIDDVMADNFMVYQCDEQIVVECDPTDDVMVYDAVGRLLTHVTGTYSSTTAKRQSHSFGLGEEQNSTTRQYRVPVPASGVYLVKVGDHPARRIVVVRM